MIPLAPGSGPLFAAFVGAHPDDIEIGCGGTQLVLAARGDVTIANLVVTGTAERDAEARGAAAAFAPGATVTLGGLDDGRLPESWGAVKTLMHDWRDANPGPDLVFVPRVDDAHQDHALVGSLARTVWRDSLILHYEIPKWDGDPARPNSYVALPDDVARRKLTLLDQSFPSQRGHDWWDEEVFLGLLRLRGMESRVRYAEAYEVGKLLLGI